VVLLEARLTQYEKDLRRAWQQTDRATRGIEQRFDQMSNNVSKKLKTIAGTVGLGLSGAQLVGLLRDAGRYADELGDVADQIGITTTQLQALRFAAEETGIAQEKLDSGLDTLARKLADAATGGKEALGQFQALGVAVVDAEGKTRSYEAVLEDVARKIGRISDPTQRSAAAIDFFGKAGARLGPLLAEASGGLDELARRADEAGRVMSEETIKTLGDAEKAIERFTQRIKVGIYSIIGDLATLVDGVTTLAEIDKSIRAFQSLEAAGLLSSSGAAKLLGPLEQTRKDLLRLAREDAGAPVIEPAGQPYQPPPPGSGSKSNAFDTALQQIEARTAALAAEAEAVKLSALESTRLTAQRELETAATKAGLALDEDRLALIYETADALALQASRTEFAKALGTAEQRIEALRQEVALVGQNAEQTQRLKTETELLNAARAAGLPITTELRAQIAAVAAEEARVTEQLRVATEELEKQQSLAEDLEGIFGQAFDRVGNAITEAFAKGEIAAIDFGNIGKAIIADLTSSFIKMAAQAAASWLAGFLMPGGGGASPGAINTVLSSTPYGTYHRGGLVGQPSGRRRADPGVFAGAQRFHAGGMPGLRPGEVPAILQKGELVLPRALVAALGGARSAAPARPPVQVNVINNASGTEARQEQRSDGLGGTTIDVTIDRIVADKAGRPGSAVHRALRTQGVRAPLVRR